MWELATAVITLGRATEKANSWRRHWDGAEMREEAGARQTHGEEGGWGGQPEPCGAKAPHGATFSAGGPGDAPCRFIASFIQRR